MAYAGGGNNNYGGGNNNQYYVQNGGAGNSGYDPSAAMSGQNKDQDLEFQWYLIYLLVDIVEYIYICINLFVHRKIDLNFDPKTETIILKIKELLSKRAWSKTMGKNDVNGKIRDEYNRLGKAIANGVCDYVYPKDSGAVIVTITYQNDKYNMSVPQDYS